MESAGLILISCLRYWGCEVKAKVISNRDDFVVDAFFYFEQVQRFEYRGDMFSFEGSGYCAYCASKGILQ